MVVLEYFQRDSAAVDFASQLFDCTQQLQSDALPSIRFLDEQVVDVDQGASIEGRVALKADSHSHVLFAIDGE
jgi:hypothetical protein